MSGDVMSDAKAEHDLATLMRLADPPPRRIIGLANDGSWLWAVRCSCGRYVPETDGFCASCGKPTEVRP